MKKLLTIILLCGLLSSCMTDVNLKDVNTDISLNPALALPIGSVHAHMTDLLSFVDSSFVNTDENNGIYIYFEQDSISIDFDVNVSFEKGEKLDETLTLGRIEAVNAAFSTIDQYIISFNEKIRTIKHILQTGELETIEPIEKPIGIVLPNEYLAQIDQINNHIETINEFAGQDISSLPEPLQKPILEALGKIKKEIDAIGELEAFTEVTLPKTEFSFTQESGYNFGFYEYIEGEKNIRVDSLLITTANIDFELYISGVDFSDGSYLLVQFGFPQLFDEAIQDRFETLKITDNKFVFREELHDAMAKLNAVNNGDTTKLTLTFTFISNGAMTISRNAKINFTSEVNAINFKELYGHIWQKDDFRTGNISFEIPAELFKSDLITKNNILLSNPQIGINFKHNIGIPMTLKLDDFYYVKDGEKTFLEKGDQRHSIEIEIEKPKEANDLSYNEFKLDNTNSPIAELIQKYPDSIGITWHVLTPWTESEDKHFFVNPLVADMDMDVTVPFQFDPTTRISYKDTIAVDLEETLSTITDIVNIDTLSLYLNITSSLPATATIKLCYLDENNNLLFESKEFTIEAAEVDGEGRVLNPTKQNKEIGFNSNLAKKIMGTKNIVFEIALTTRDNNSKLYIQSTDKLDIDLSAYAKAKINLTTNSQE